jgi:hypothetical protein
VEVIMNDEVARRPARDILAVDAADADGAGGAVPQALLDMVRRVRARERGYLAGLLHDGPVQALAVVALELGELFRAMGAPPDDGPDGLAQQVHAVGLSLRGLQDELWPFPRAGSGLIETLKRRTAWLLATPLAVAAGEGVAELPEADVQAVADVTELILVGLDDAETWNRPIAAVRAYPDLVFLELNMTPAPGRDLASGGSGALREWLHCLAAAIQARADVVLDDRRLRIWIEIPRRPDRCPGAHAGGVPAGAVMTGPDYPQRHAT